MDVRMQIFCIFYLNGCGFCYDIKSILFREFNFMQKLLIAIAKNIIKMLLWQKINVQ